MPVREVVLDRDMRSPLRVSPQALLTRYYLRRTASALTLIALDLLALVTATLLVPYALHSWLSVAAFPLTPLEIVVAALIVVAVAAALGLYGRRRARHRLRTLLVAALCTLPPLALLVMLCGDVRHAGWLLLVWAFGALAAIGLRRAYDLTIAAVIGEDIDAERLLVIGSAADGPRVRATLSAAHPEIRHTLVGTLAPTDLATLDDTVERLWPSQILVADLAQARADVDRLLAVCRRRHIPLKVVTAGVPSSRGAEPASATADEAVRHLDGLDRPLFAVREPGHRHGAFVVKRLLDLVAAALFTVILSPLMLVIAVAVKITSPGPVLYVSPRVGVGQRPFPCYKFRTMCADAPQRQAALEARNEAEGCIFKIAADPRVTPVGRILRRTSLDELPQLFNVLRGQMSLVGPRPLPLRDVDLMQDRQRKRHVVLPGITGLWQVSARGDLSGDEMLALDLHYIETWSLRGDLAILARTVRAVFGSKGAY